MTIEEQAATRVYIVAIMAAILRAADENAQSNSVGGPEYYAFEAGLLFAAVKSEVSNEPIL